MSFESAVAKNRRVPIYKISALRLEKIAFFWMNGSDTRQIALRMSIAEHHVYNSMDKVKRDLHARASEIDNMNKVKGRV